MPRCSSQLFGSPCSSTRLLPDRFVEFENENDSSGKLGDSGDPVSAFDGSISVDGTS